MKNFKQGGNSILYFFIGDHNGLVVINIADMEWKARPPKQQAAPQFFLGRSVLFYADHTSTGAVEFGFA